MADGEWAFLLAGGAGVVAGLALLAVALFADRSRGRRRCGKCWDDMGGVPGLVCPECGREAKGERGLLRTRRRWRLAGLSVVLVGAGVVTAEWRRLEEGNWPALVPDGALRIVLGWFKDDAAGVRSTGSKSPMMMRMTRMSSVTTWQMSHWQRLLIASDCISRIEAAMGEWEAVATPRSS